MGESMGALIALSLAKDHEGLFDAMMLVAPFLGFKKRIPGKCLLKGVASLFPTASVNFRKCPPKDPLKHAILRLGTAKTLLNAAKAFRNRMQDLHTDF